MKISRNKIIAGVLIIAALTAAFFWGDGYASRDNSRAAPAADDMSSVAPTVIFEDGSVSPPEQQAAAPVPARDGETEAESQVGSNVGTAATETAAADKSAPTPTKPRESITADSTETYTCTLSVRCDTILNNIDRLDPEKTALVPADGFIFAASDVIFYAGESVFNVLQREMKQAGIHMDFKNMPVYNSAYIRSIDNLYEFDCGELSGWLYKVNGDWLPNYGCSRYVLQNGDVVEWIYTCDLGKDVGRE